LTVDQFIHEAQGYYGPYNAIQRKYVSQWLRDRSDQSRPLIWAEVLKSLSPVYHTPPGIRELEIAWQVVQDRRWPELPPPIRPQIDDQMTDEEREQVAANCRELIEGLAKSKTLAKNETGGES